MSRFGHAAKDRCIVRSFRVELSGGSTIDPHHHDWHQLVYASYGALEVTTPANTWLVPSRRAVWVPADARHSILVLGRTLVETIYVAAAFERDVPRECTAINVSDLLRALVIDIARIGTLDETQPQHRRLAGVLLDLVRSAAQLDLQVPMPADDRALAVARMVLDDPANKETLAALARRAASSERTMARVFVQETGMTFARWRAAARFVRAVRDLASGTPIGEVAGEVGYESPSAFISAFKRAFGVTPGRFLND
ncbi:MAG TPA: helix-turn-helix transcriptional regulator [Candidatus Acidoferrales bacterium]|jgi:AraC-like DNA-binding protein|nr:helix-turn-helix transcriptional regulator [Candidatus Acidoferrales bacterium]